MGEDVKVVLYAVRWHELWDVWQATLLTSLSVVGLAYLSACLHFESVRNSLFSDSCDMAWNHRHSDSLVRHVFVWKS